MPDREPGANRLDTLMAELRELPDGDPRGQALIDEIVELEVAHVQARVRANPAGFIADVEEVRALPPKPKDPRAVYAEQMRTQASDLFQRGGDLLEEGKPKEASDVLMRAIGILSGVGLPIPNGYNVLLERAIAAGGGNGLN